MLMNTGSIIRYESCESARQGSPPQFTSRLRLNVAENLAAAFDLDLAVANRPGDAPAGFDQEPLAHDEIAFEATANLGILNRGRAFEQAALGDFDIAAPSDATISTSSLWQVRQPVYARSIGRWRAYAPHVPELTQFSDGA